MERKGKNGNYGETKDISEKGKIVEILNKDNRLEEELQDKTLYGEFMSTYNYWVSPEKQRERVNELENSTKKEK